MILFLFKQQQQNHGWLTALCSVSLMRDVLSNRHTMNSIEIWNIYKFSTDVFHFLVSDKIKNCEFILKCAHPNSNLNAAC